MRAKLPDPITPIMDFQLHGSRNQTEGERSAMIMEARPPEHAGSRSIRSPSQTPR